MRRSALCCPSRFINMKHLLLKLTTAVNCGRESVHLPLGCKWKTPFGQRLDSQFLFNLVDETEARSYLFMLMVTYDVPFAQFFSCA